MAEEEAKKVDPEPCAEAPPVAAPVAAEPVESPKDVAEEKAVIPAPPPVEEKADESKALAIVESKSSTLYHTSLFNFQLCICFNFCIFCFIFSQFRGKIVSWLRKLA